jgi:hypothetical protein
MVCPLWQHCKKDEETKFQKSVHLANVWHHIESRLNSYDQMRQGCKDHKRDIMREAEQFMVVPLNGEGVHEGWETKGEDVKEGHSLKR